MPHPEGYRKADAADGAGRTKFGKPVVTFIDTPGAYPGIGAEERGQAEAIARNLKLMAGLPVPIVAVVTGEGGSGGALAIGMGNRVLMLEYAVYSVISPEGCAAILWGDAAKAPEAAEVDADHRARPAAARRHRRHRARARRRRPSRLGGGRRRPARARCASTCAALAQLSPDALVADRYEKFRRIGAFEETGRCPRALSAQRCSRPVAHVLVGDEDVHEAAAQRAAHGLDLRAASGHRDHVAVVAARERLQPLALHREHPVHERAQLRPVDDAALGVERLVVDLADHAELAQALDADAVRLGQRAEARRALGDEADAAQRDVHRLGGLEDRADLRIAQQAPALALDLAQRDQVLHGQGVGPHVGAVLGRHHADQRVGEEVDELERALAGQRDRARGRESRRSRSARIVW